MSTDWKQIKQEYIDSKGTALLKDLAEKYGVKPATMRSRKNREKWDDDIEGGVATCNATQKKKVQRNTKSVATQKVKERKDTAPRKALEVVVEDNSELTEMQRAFCLYYIKNRNATMAAIKAGYAPDSAHVRGHELVRNSKVRAEIKKLKGAIAEDLLIDDYDILDRYIKTAFSDMTDFVEFGTELIEVGVASGGTKEVEVDYLKIKNSFEVDGSLISEIKQGRNGVSIKLEDRQKALDKLAVFFDLFPDKFKRKIDDEKLRISQERLELDKAKVTGDIEDAEDDGFLEALNDSVEEVWDDEEN